MKGPASVISFRPSWRYRRGLVFAVSAFCAMVIAYLTARGQDTRLAESIASGAFLLLGTVVGSYVFGAAWDDKNVMAHESGRERRSGAGREASP